MTLMQIKIYQGIAWEHARCWISSALGAIMAGNLEQNSGTLSAAGAIAMRLRVNGVEHLLPAEPRMTLAEALRGPLGLIGTKIACNRGACSACTVWLDGEPICSCMILAIDVGERMVTTIEGLSHGEQLHAVQEAFIAHDATQCGFCTPGLVMSAAALLAHTPQPTLGEIKAALSGHFCRCGSYPKVFEAILAASARPEK